MSHIFGAPRTGFLTKSDTLPFVAPTHPVELGPVLFNKLSGRVEVQVTDVGNGNTFSFQMVGGFGPRRDPLDQRRHFALLSGSGVDCTFTYVSPSEWDVTAFGQTYRFIFGSSAAAQNTIQKTAGPLLTGDLIIRQRTCTVDPFGS